MTYIVPNNGSVGIIGGGISGLSYAFFLSKFRPDIKIRIFESSKRSGGWINTEFLKINGKDVGFEKGPRTLRGINDGTLLIIDILKQLGKEEQIEYLGPKSPGNRKYLLNNSDEIMEIHSFKALQYFLNSGLMKAFLKSIIMEPFQKKRIDIEDESIEHFVSRRLNKSLSDNLLSALIHGIYAGDVANLSVKSIFPRLPIWEKKYGSIIIGMVKQIGKKNKNLSETLIDYQNNISPQSNMDGLSNDFKRRGVFKLRDGLEVLPQALSHYLMNQDNVEIEYNSNIKSISCRDLEIQTSNATYKYDHIHSTINWNIFQDLIHPSNRKTSIKIDYVSILLISVYTKRIVIPKEQSGFGFLVPKSNKNDNCLLGVIYDSDVENNAQAIHSSAPKSEKPFTKLTLMMGGHFYRNKNKISESFILQSAKKVMRDILKINANDNEFIFRNGLKDESKILNINAKDILLSYNFLPECIPQYNVGHEKQKQEVHRLLTQEYSNNITLGGMCFGSGPGVPDCIQNALRNALLCSSCQN